MTFVLGTQYEQGNISVDASRPQCVKEFFLAAVLEPTAKVPFDVACFD